MQEGALRADERLDPPRHLVEVTAQVGHLVAPPAHEGGDAGLEVPGRKRSERGPEVADRPRDVPREGGAENEADDGADRERDPGRRGAACEEEACEAGPVPDRDEEYPLVAAGEVDAARPLPFQVGLGPGAGALDDVRRDGAGEEIPAGSVDGVELYVSVPAPLLHQAAERGDSAVAKGGGGGFDDERRTRAALERGVPTLVGEAIEPGRQADAEDDEEERGPVREEELPEEPAHLLTPSRAGSRGRGRSGCRSGRRRAGRPSAGGSRRGRRCSGRSGRAAARAPARKARPS